MTDRRVMLITGATGCIGSEIARQAVTAHWSLVVQGRRRAAVQKLVTELQQIAPPGCDVRGVDVDINTADGPEQLVQSAAACFDRIDAVVDCLVTGPGHGQVTGSFDNTDADTYLAVMALSVVYLQRLTRALIPWLQRSEGCLVTLVADAALYPAPKQALIGTARAAEVAFIKNFATEASAWRVRAHCISLSFVENTRIVAQLSAANASRLDRARQRAGLGLPAPVDVAPLALFLCGSGAMHITGQVISINGGLNV